MIEVIPFGNVLEDRFKISKDYKLIESISGFWRLTEKGRKNYDPVSYINYLQGKIEKPERLKATNVTIVPQKEENPREIVVNQLLAL